MKDKVLVIGNGVHVNKAHIQEKEDRYKYVVRMNDYELTEQNVGSITSIWAVNTNYRLTKKRASQHIRNKNGEPQILIIGPEEVKTRKCLEVYKKYKYKNITTETIAYDQVKKTIRHNPTLGLCVIQYFMNQRYKVVATGYDLMVNPGAFCLHYWGKLDGKRYGQWYPHDKNKEREYLLKARENGVTFV